MREFFKSQLSHAGAFVRWVVIGCGIGLLVGAVAVAFHFGIELANELRIAHPWLIWLLPVGGVAIVLLYRFGGMSEDRGTNLVLVAVQQNERMRLRTAPLVFISTIITHLLGGSACHEGAALQIGGSIASSIGHKAKLDNASVRIMVVCGMSAAFSAMFGTPLTAAIFAMEVVHVGVMHYSAIVPAMLSALVGLQVADWFGGIHTRFIVTGIPALGPLSLLQVMAIGVLFALLAILFYQAIHAASHLYKKYLPNPILRVVVGGTLVIILTLLTGTHDYNGAGMGVITAAIGGVAKPGAFALKILFTAVTLSAGFKGGEIIPAFFTGATFGCVVGPMLGLDPSFAAALGMTALFCGITNCPITSLLLSLELFGAEGLPFFALCCAVSYMLSGYGGLYTEQKIMYSKHRHEERRKTEQDMSQAETMQNEEVSCVEHL